MNFLYNYLKAFVSDEEGQTAAEYALILILISLAAIASAPQLGSAIAGAYGKIVAQL